MDENPHQHEILDNLTWCSIATVTKTTDWCFIQFVHVEITAVANTNVVTPLTAIVGPVITYFASDCPFGFGRMSALHPSRSVGSTVV